ncbi:MAG: glycosyltransferase family 4 protein [Anaerolineales bacterium]|nr:glycosyltransferase family 4 protein [Anaerolineales bacterium]
MNVEKTPTSRRPLRILFLVTILTIGGAPLAILRLAKGLQRKGYDVLVVCLYSRRNSVPHFTDQFGIQIIDLEMKNEKIKNPFIKIYSIVKGLIKLFTLMRGGHYDVLQTFIESSNIIGPIIGWFAGIPVRVSSQRATLVYKSRLFFLIDRWIVNSCLVDKMVTVSENTRKFCITKEKMSPQKLATIYNGVDLERFTPRDRDEYQQLKNLYMRDMGLSEETILITSVGRLHKQKGYDFLLQAIPEVRLDHKNARFIFVGDGDMRESLQSLSRSLGLDSVVYFLGIREDIPEILAISDLFILPSRWEGFPNVLLEAMSTGLAVIASAIDGSIELIEHGENGMLVPPSNPNKLAKTIIQLLENVELRVRLGQAARKHVEKKFSEDKFIDSFAALYEDLFQKKSFSIH